jgi:hypothetical protein
LLFHSLESDDVITDFIHALLFDFTEISALWIWE